MTWQDGGAFLGFLSFGVSVVAFARSKRAMECESNVKAEVRRMYVALADAVSGVTATSRETIEHIHIVLRKHRRETEAPAPFRPRIVGRDPEADTRRASARPFSDCGDHRGDRA